MAKLPQGIMGPFIGRIGTAVGYMWNGKCCARSYNPKKRNPRTPEQVAHREMFKQEVQLAADMRWPVTKTMTDMARTEGITSYNLFVRENQHAFGFDNGSLVVDYSTLRLSIGDVAPVSAEEVSLTEDNVLNVRFARGTGRGFDEVYLYVYVPDLKKGFLSSSAYRRDKRIAIALPDDYAGHRLHAWLMAKSEDGRWSDSTYVDCSGQLPVSGCQFPVSRDQSADASAVPSQGVSPSANHQHAEHTPPDDTGQKRSQ